MISFFSFTYPDSVFRQTNREELAQTIAQERGSTLIPAYDHPDIIAGQGTTALELIEEVGDRLFPTRFKLRKQ